MARKNYKAKEPVRVRTKELKDGNKSLYLDIYQKGNRRREFLRLYLVPEHTTADRLQNAQTMRAANAIKAQRVIDLTNNAAGVMSNSGEKVLLLDWLLNYPRTQAQKSNKLQLLDAATAKALNAFAGVNVRLSDVDKQFCTDFAQFLSTKYQSRRGTLTAASAKCYFVRFVCALNAAVRNGVIAQNPCAQLSPSDKIKVPASERCYLTAEELQRFIEATPNVQRRYLAMLNITKQAFLFSCFCGLRISDVRNLTWENITESNGQKQAIIRMQKTQAPLYLPLSNAACSYMPERGEAPAGAKVFNLSPSFQTISTHVKAIAAAAGIEKNVTFHTARHTFATLLLTKGADLYTTSKLLGHANITTTQIYAKIIDEKKQAAVQLLDNVF